MSSNFEELEQQGKLTFWEHIGFQKEQVLSTSVIISLRLRSEHMNSLGIVHGGVLMAMLDNAMGLVIMQDQGHRTVTATMNTHFLSNISNGTIFCKAELLHRTKRTITMKALIYSETGEQLAYATGAYRLLT